jgi:hypothetical protein
MDFSVYAGYFTALYNDDVYLFEPITTKDPVYKSSITAWQEPVHAVGNVQAYSGDLAFKEYGIHVTCEKQIFLPPTVMVLEGWGIAFSSALTEPELYVKHVEPNKTHTFILAGTR